MAVDPLDGGELVNRKYRSRPPDKAFVRDKDPIDSLFNVDRLGGSPDLVVFVEGELDVLALFECGIENAVTLKGGAGKEARIREDDKRFGAIQTHADLLKRVKKLILAGDGDDPGRALREELARRLGRLHCWMVTWPNNCKDPSDTLWSAPPWVDKIKLAF